MVRHASDYRVDGEVGRFRLGLFDVVDETDEMVLAGHRLWPSRQGQQGYPTAGFKELALLTGATQRSYRQTVGHFNRSRHQAVGGTPLNSLRDGAEREGRQVIEFLDRHRGGVLSTHRFDADGRPEPAAPLLGELGTGGEAASDGAQVAEIERPGQRFTLTGTSVAQVLRFVLAFLLTKVLIGQRLRFFTDAQRSLQGAIVTFFSWYPAASRLLDGFHLVKKFKEELSLACRGREIRNRHLKVLRGLLWFGLLDRAQAYLRSIASAELKNTAAVERLIGYLERNRSGIPCYALRRQLGLPNSSNSVERANNLVTSNRQKHHGVGCETGSSLSGSLPKRLELIVQVEILCSRQVFKSLSSVSRRRFSRTAQKIVAVSS